MGNGCSNARCSRCPQNYSNDDDGDDSDDYVETVIEFYGEELDEDGTFKPNSPSPNVRKNQIS